MKLLLDTNVLIDFVAPREPFVQDIRRLCVASMFGDVQLWVSVQSYADAFYVLGKHAEPAAIRSALLESLELFNPCGLYAADLKPALLSDWPDVEDYLIAHAAKHLDADYFITRDRDVVEKSPVPAMSASEFVALLENEYGLVYEDVTLD